MSQYQTKRFREDGSDNQSEPSPLDELDGALRTQAAGDAQKAVEAQLAAREGIEHFVAFCRKFLAEHPPETHIMLSQGFGVRLQGGYSVSLAPIDNTLLAGHMEPSPAFGVTSGMSNPGMRGVEPGVSYGITGVQQNPGLRGPSR